MSEERGVVKQPAGPSAEDDAAVRGGTPGWVTVTLGGAEFGLPIGRVREVLPPPPVSKVPLAAEAVRGVVSVRGEVVPVVDLGLRLGRARAQKPGRLVVVLEAESREPVGLLVDQVSGLVDAGAQRAERVPDEVAASVPEGLIGGVVTGEAGRTIALLDLDRVLDMTGGGPGEGR